MEMIRGGNVMIPLSMVHSITYRNSDEHFTIGLNQFQHAGPENLS